MKIPIGRKARREKRRRANTWAAHEAMIAADNDCITALMIEMDEHLKKVGDAEGLALLWEILDAHLAKLEEHSPALVEHLAAIDGGAP